MMIITVTGLFKDMSRKDTPLNYFNRTFIIVPEGSGYCIRNEQLFICNPTEMQEKQAKRRPAAVPDATSSAAPTYAPPHVGAAAATPEIPVLTEELKQQMTFTLSQQTNMNIEWSIKCLEDVKWNYDIALAAFHELFNLGRVPPEAFKK